MSRKNEDGKENLYEHDELSSCSRRFGFNCFIQAYYEETEEEHSKEFCDFLNGRGGCSKAQVLVDNGTTWSFINQRFAKKLPLTYLLRKFVISLKNGKVCCTKGKFSVDLKFVDGMNSKRHLQVIDSETSYCILLMMDFIQEISVNSGFYRTQKLMVVDFFMILQSTFDITRD